MNDDTLLEDLSSLAAALGASAWQTPSLRPARWILTSEWLDSPAQTCERLLSFDPAARGWLEFTDAALPWRAGQPLPAGMPLNGELAAGARSLQLRQCDGRWHCVTAHDLLASQDAQTFDAAISSQPPGELLDGWVLRREQLHAHPGSPPWIHDVLLQRKPDGRLQETAARLIDPPHRKPEH